MNDLDIRDISIIDALPRYDWSGRILTVGCGKGRLEKYLGLELKYKVVATDIKAYPEWIKQHPYLEFRKADIMDLSTFRLPNTANNYGVVICSQVLEHLEEWETALKILLELTAVRLIITVPCGHSYDDPDHKNWWWRLPPVLPATEKSPVCDHYYHVQGFKELCDPYSVAISMLHTKPEDHEMNQTAFLIVVDKRQVL